MYFWSLAIEVYKLDNIKFTPQDILHKQFKERNIGKGYDEADVDAFLDDVIKDYDTYNKELERLIHQPLLSNVHSHYLNDQLPY